MTRATKKQKLQVQPAEDKHQVDSESSVLMALEKITDVATNSVLIVAGTYERLLYGFQVLFSEEDPNKLKVTPQFIMPIHIGYISTLSMCSKFLASGSTDEVIKLFDIKRRKELGSLHEHTGTITKVVFFGNSHLLSASADGSIIIYRTKDWEVLKVLRGHLKQINDIAIHPSGKLAISVSKDRSAIVWNLLTGHKASRTKFLSEGELVRFSNSGDQYTIVSIDNKITTYDITKGQEISSYQANSKVLDLLFIKFNDSTEYLLFGGSDKSLHLLDTKTGNEILSFKVHDNRVKGISSAKISDTKGNEMSLIVTVSSDSKLRIWNQNDIENLYLSISSSKISKESPSEQQEIKWIGEYSVGCRLTCVDSGSTSNN